MTKIRFCLLVCFVLGVAVNAFPQNRDFTKLNQYLDSLDSYDRFMGTILIAHQGKPVFERSVGFADLEKGIKANPQTHYRIGSITKMYTTVLVFQAIQSGKLSLDTRLSEFFPQVPNAEKITVSMMLQHRSGIFNFTNRMDYDFFRSKPLSEAQVLEMIVAAGSVFEPDSKADYSNSNFVLLTLILEKIEGTSYSKLLQSRIFEPLGLRNTYVFGTIDPTKNEARSYLYQGEWKVDREADPSVPSGAGNLTSDVQDLDGFIRGLFDGKLINSESLASMREFKDGFGRGMFSFPYYDRKSLGHTGGIDGFRSFLAYFPEDELSITVLSNGLNFNQNDLLLAMLDSYFEKEWELPPFKASQLSSEQLQSYLGTYSSAQLPLILVFSEKNGSLAVQPSGQPLTVLEQTGADRFEFKQAGASFTFNLESGELTLTQGGLSFLYRKQVPK